MSEFLENGASWNPCKFKNSGWKSLFQSSNANVNFEMRWFYKGEAATFERGWLEIWMNREVAFRVVCDHRSETEALEVHMACRANFNCTLHWGLSSKFMPQSHK